MCLTRISDGCGTFLILKCKIIDKIFIGYYRMIISLQGLNARKYQQVCKVTLDYEEFYANLQYLYQIKKDTLICVKVVDAALEVGEEQLFYEKFALVALIKRHLIEWLCHRLPFDETTILGNQAPFYFDASMPDLYTPLCSGAILHMIPEKLFLFPNKLLDYPNQKLKSVEALLSRYQICKSIWFDRGGLCMYLL